VFAGRHIQNSAGARETLRQRRRDAEHRHHAGCGGKAAQRSASEDAAGKQVRAGTLPICCAIQWRQCML
jgi:hypothetical protein